METVNNNVNSNQPSQPQKENENKKKNKIVAWWLGLSKWAKVGVCVGTAAVLATAITLPIVLTKCGGENSKDYIPFEIREESKSYIDVSKYPTKIKKTDKTFKYTVKPISSEGVLCSLLNQDGVEIVNSSHSFSVSSFEQSYTVTGLNITQCTKIELYCYKGA